MNKRIKLSDFFTYKKLYAFTLPSIATMIFLSIYSLVDGLFVIYFASQESFVALNIVMPLLIVISAFGIMMGTGGSAIVAKTLGEGKKELANQYFTMFVMAGFLLGIVLAILGIYFLEDICSWLEIQGRILQLATAYGRILLIALPFFSIKLRYKTFLSQMKVPK